MMKLLIILLILVLAILIIFVAAMVGLVGLPHGNYSSSGHNNNDATLKKLLDDNNATLKKLLDDNNATLKKLMDDNKATKLEKMLLAAAFRADDDDNISDDEKKVREIWNQFLLHQYFDGSSATRLNRSDDDRDYYTTSDDLSSEPNDVHSLKEELGQLSSGWDRSTSSRSSEERRV